MQFSESRRGKDISVNINDWLNRQHNPHDHWRHSSGVVGEEKTVEELIDEADRRQEDWLEAERLRVLEEKLEGEAISCGECSLEERPYKNDYLCFKCRDKMESSP